MSTRTFDRQFQISAVFTLTVALAISLSAQTAFAGKPVFQRTKPHVNVGSSVPTGVVVHRPTQPPAPHVLKPTMIFNQPRSAASGAEYKYVPVRRTAGVTMEQLELMHEGWLPAPGAASPGGHVKVFSGTRW